MNSAYSVQSGGKSARNVIWLREFGLMDYKDAWDLQESLFDISVSQKLDQKHDPGAQPPVNHLILCEHPAVFTLGTSGIEEHLLLSQEKLLEKKIQFIRNNRGGDITFHGPGQIVGYPILDLEQFRPDIKAYMHSLEEVIIRTIGEYGLKGERIEGAVGIWLDAEIPRKSRKICAFGVKTSRWITMHGWALNVNTDLEYFNYIVPCGISDKGVTSLERELGSTVDVEEVRHKIVRHFSDVFNADVIPVQAGPMAFAREGAARARQKKGF